MYEVELAAQKAWVNMFDGSSFSDDGWYGEKNIPAGTMRCYADIVYWGDIFIATVKIMMYVEKVFYQQWVFNEENEEWEYFDAIDESFFSGDV